MFEKALGTKRRQGAKMLEGNKTRRSWILKFIKYITIDKYDQLK